MSLFETHRSFVNMWECDENAHMNVQFYLKRFDEAARFFALLDGNGSHEGALPAIRHVRYYSELRMAQQTVIQSSQISDGPFAGWIVHFMRENVTRRLCATAIESPSGNLHKHSINQDSAAEALPRSIRLDPHMPVDGEDILNMGGFVAHRCIVPPAECSVHGEMMQQFYIARFTDGAPHVWDHTGIGTKWLNENGLGRVAVEMKVCHHQPARAGDAIELFSLASSIEGKTVRLHHELRRATDGAALASCEVLALVMDLATRKAVAMPKGALKKTAGHGSVV